MKKIFGLIKLGKIDSSERPIDFCGDFLARYDYVAKRSQGKTVVDVGCGIGYGSAHIASAGAKSVLGTDYSRAAIVAARDKYRMPNLSFSVSDARDMSGVREKFDIVVSFETIEHIRVEEMKKYVEEMKGLMKEEGVFYVSTPNKLISSPGRKKPYNPVHFKEFEPQELTDFLQHFFSRVELMGISCINKRYLDVESENIKTLRHKLASFSQRFNLARKLLIFIPVSLKQRFTGEHRLPRLDASDYSFSSHDIERDGNLFAICRK